MTRQKKRGAKPSTLTEKLDIESPSSSEPSPGSKGNINVSPLENADESKTPAGRALLAVKSLRERDLNSTTTIVDANGQVKTPTRLGLPMKVENRNVSTKPESLQMVANGNSASIDGFNTKVQW